MSVKPRARDRPKGRGDIREFLCDERREDERSGWMGNVIAAVHGCYAGRGGTQAGEEKNFLRTLATVGGVSALRSGWKQGPPGEGEGAGVEWAVDEVQQSAEAGHQSGGIFFADVTFDEGFAEVADDTCGAEAEAIPEDDGPWGGLWCGSEECSGEAKPEPAPGGAANKCTDEAHSGFSGTEFGCEATFAPESAEGVGAGVTAFHADDHGGECEVAEFFSGEPAELSGDGWEQSGIEEDDEVTTQRLHGDSGRVEADGFECQQEQCCGGEDCGDAAHGMQNGDGGVELQMEVEPTEECDEHGEWAGSSEAWSNAAHGEQIAEFPCGPQADESTEEGEQAGSSAEGLIGDEECDERGDEQAGHEQSPAEHWCALSGSCAGRLGYSAGCVGFGGESTEATVAGGVVLKSLAEVVFAKFGPEA